MSIVLHKKKEQEQARAKRRYKRSATVLFLGVACCPCVITLPQMLLLFYLTHNLLPTLKVYQLFAEQQRVPPVMRHRPGDEVLHMLQLAAKLYGPLQPVLQMLLKTAGDTLWSSEDSHVAKSQNRI